MTMQATVLSVTCDSLLVLDHSITRQPVRVFYPGSCRFRRGNLVCIRFGGIMTGSIPPQITATRITVIPRFGLFPPQCR